MKKLQNISEKRKVFSHDLKWRKQCPYQARQWTFVWDTPMSNRINEALA